MTAKFNIAAAAENLRIRSRKRTAENKLLFEKATSEPFLEQMAHVGSEISRSLSWQERDPEISKAAFYRALELMDLTIQKANGFYRRCEFARMRELMTDFFAFDTIYKTSGEYWQSVFMQYARAWAMARHAARS